MVSGFSSGGVGTRYLDSLLLEPGEHLFPARLHVVPVLEPMSPDMWSTPDESAVPLFNTPIISPVLIGRAPEMEMLEHSLHAAQRGRGQCLTVAGDAGVGKSRLLAEIRHRADAERFLTLQGACFEPDSSFPYAPLVDALRAHWTQRAPPELREILGPLAPEIVKLVPELALVLPDLRPTPALNPEAEKRRLFESLVQLFIRLSATQPLLILLEDLHWSDDLSLEFLHLLACRIPAHRIVLLASYRRDEAPPRLTHLLAQLDRERLASEITLAPLTRAEVDSMLRAILHLSDPAKSEFLDPLYALTEGNPFLIEEVLKALIAAGEILYMEGRWEAGPINELHIPRSVQAAVQRRTSRLGRVGREVLTLAAVAGRRFEFALLRETTGLEEQALLQIVKELIGAQLVVEESADRFAFRHALTREAVYATLLQRERQVLHRRVAEALERVHEGALGSRVADLAYHYHAAGVWEKALWYARRAGEHALALNAPHSAIDQFNRALDAAQRLSLSPPAEILRARAGAYHTAGYFAPARDEYERALSAAREAHDEATEWQGLIGLGRLWTSRDYARTGDYFQRALELARTLGDAATVAHSLNRLGNWYANVAEPGEALPYHREALELFDRLGDRRGVVETLDIIGMACQLDSDLGQAHESYRRAIGLWRELGDQRGLASSLASLPLCAANYFHDVDVPAIRRQEAIGAGEEGVRIAREIGWRAGEAFGLHLLAACLGPLGEYARALDAARATLEIAKEIEHRQWITAGHTVLGRLYLDMLALDAARSHLEQALALATAIGSRVWTDSAAGMLAATYVEQRELERAEALLSGALANDTPMRTQTQRLCWYARGELALARGRAETALQIAEGLIASARNTAEETVIPRLWKLRGAALIRLHRARQAAAVLQTAREAASEQGTHPLLWRIHALLGRAYRAEGRRGDAEAEFSAARELIRSLAAKLSDEALRHEFLERGMAILPRLRTPSSRRVEKEKFGGLTAREREVAALIARGKSNRQMAEELFIGVRTIEAHVTHILLKLGFASRAQIAAWAVEKGLTRASWDDDE